MNAPEPPKTTIDQLIRNIANELRDIRDFGATVSEKEAAGIFHRASQNGLCPICAASNCKISGARQAMCRDCGGTFSLTAGTALRRTKIDLVKWLAAVWHLHVDNRTISCRGFAARYGMRDMTAWEMLCKVREAFPRFVPGGGSSTAQILGFEVEENAAEVRVAHEEGRLCVLPAEDVTASPQPGARENPLWLGNLHAWLVSNFHGVSRRHLWLYLAEFADRFRRGQGEAGVVIRACTP